MRSFHVVMTSGSNKLEGLLAETVGGPAMLTESVPYGGRQGHHDTLILGSGDRGSGQVVGHDQKKYNSAIGWDAMLPGHIRTAQAAQSSTIIDAAYPVSSDTARGGFFKHTDAVEILITPEGIYENGTSVDVVAAGSRFTGSWAVFGDRIFFGVESDTTRASATMRVRTAAATYGNAGMSGSYLTVVGSRMFVVSNNAANPRVSVAWTDETGNSSPTMSTSYTYPTELYAMDSGQLGPALVVAVSDSYQGEIITLDIGGTFTNLIAGFTQPFIERLIPFNGGLFALSDTLSNSLFFSSIDNVSPIALPFSSLVTNHLDITAGASGGFIASEVNQMVVSSPTGSVVVLTVAEDGQIAAHQSPLAGSGLSRLLAAYIGNDGTGKCLRVAGLKGSPVNDLTTVSLPLYDEQTFYSGANAVTGNIYSGSEIPIPGGELAQILAFSATARLLNGGGIDGTEYLRVTINGSVFDVTTASANLGDSYQTFRIECDETILARSVTVSFQYVDSATPTGALVDLAEPFVLEYVTTPNQYQEVTFTIQIGSLQINRVGGFTKQSRATVINLLETMVANPAIWTVTFWDSTEWKVIPLRWRMQEIEEAFRPGEGKAVVALTCKRLRDTGRVLT